jgi:putative glucose/galactose transporter
MGLFGGTIFPFAMGLASDAMNGSQIGALIVLSIGVLYLFLMSTQLKANA